MNALDYEPVKALTEEVERFKATNKFTPMLVTGFYIQAGIVLNILAATQAELDGADKVIANLKAKIARLESQQNP